MSKESIARNRRGGQTPEVASKRYPITIEEIIPPMEPRLMRTPVDDPAYLDLTSGSARGISHIISVKPAKMNPKIGIIVRRETRLSQEKISKRTRRADSIPRYTMR